MKMSNRIRRNIYLVLAIFALIRFVGQVINLIAGERNWTILIGSLLLAVLFAYWHLYYRKQVNEGNLF